MRVVPPSGYASQTGPPPARVAQWTNPKTNMRKNMELWRELQVGDRIRLVEIPKEFLQEGYYIHRDTLRVYKKLLARRRSLRIHEIDEGGLPWVHCRFRRKNGRWEHHFLALNHGGLVRVKPRRRA